MGRLEKGNQPHIQKHYRALMKQCQVRLADMDSSLPEPVEDFNTLLEERGVSRRSFLKWSSMLTAALMLPPMFEPMVAKAAEQFNRLPVVWLHLAECTGCSEALLRSSYPNVDDILLDTISLEYHETLMAAAGHQAEANLEKAIADFPGKFVCVLEGAIPRGMGGKYLTLGPRGLTGLELARHVTAKAGLNICMGSCSAFGNIPASHPNPTDAAGVGKALGISTVNIAGCPPNPTNFVGTVLHFLMFGGLPSLDSLGRPTWAYGKRIHDFCERRPHYDAGEFVEEWDDSGARNRWCLYKMGCKGPHTFANCSRVRFNDGISWPILAGHGCIGCTEPAFWDTMKPLEQPISKDTIGGGERTVDTIGTALAGLTIAGIAVHAGVSALVHKEDKQ